MSAVNQFFASRTYALWLVLVFALYCIAALIGLNIHAVNTFASLIWPATGIALAALAIGGYRLWPAIFLGAFFVNFYTGAPLLIALMIGIGNTLEALVGAYFLRGWDALKFSFGTLRESLIFIFCVSLGATLISATIGVVSLLLGGLIPVSEFEPTWLAWWVGDALGALVVAPFLLRWLSDPYHQRSVGEYMEMVLIAVLSGLVTAFVFATPYVGMPYPILIPLVWAALRTGPRGITLAMLTMSIIAIAGTVMGQGPFSNLHVEDGLLQLQFFLATIISLFLMFTSVVEDRRRATKELKSHVGELEHVLERLRTEDRTKNEFIATLAHELRNPLAPIVSSIELIKSGTTKSVDVVRQASVLEKHARTMSKLLNDLLDVSRISAQKLEFSKKPMHLCEAADHAVESVEPIFKAKNHTLDVSINPRPILIDADPLRIEQIVTNLLTNAAKYTPHGGRIALSVTRQGTQAVITVKDNGIGIPAHMMARIFDPFLQVKRAKSAEGGIGIGLSLTKRLVEMHGGTIEAESLGEGKGSVFTVHLPLPAPGQFVENSSESSRTRKRTLPKLKILIVDDNVDAANALGKLLGLQGHEVSLAQDGASAMRMAPLVSPDAIILDIGLPDLDGYEIARRLKKSKIVCPLIALTGYGQASDKTKARSAGFSEHLTKPVSLARVEEALSRVLAKKA